MQADIAVHVLQPGEDPHDVAVQQRHGKIEGDTADSAGGVSADARQIEQLPDIARDSPIISLHDDAGSAMQVTGAAIISQTFPKLQHVVKTRVRQGFDRRKRREKALENRERPFLLVSAAA